MNKLDVYKNKKVLITGHTGFKGSWLSQWLLLLQARVYGYALEAPTNPSLFDQLKLSEEMDSYLNDVRDLKALKSCIDEVKPDIIFHLAAQSLVRDSYEDPINTIETNINGTVNVLEAVRQLDISTTIIVITSDKCYENKEWIHGYRENDAMGGYDPYSMSKGAAELVVSSYRRSFFNPMEYKKHGVKLASARAGNVIGGGDWAKDRIIPDCMRALQKGEEIIVRNPYATRPWQHVLESLGGYLTLGSTLLSNDDNNLDVFCSGFNFGPFTTSNKNVESLVTAVLENWPGKWKYNESEAVHEAFLLNLNIDKAVQILNWQPVWGFDATVKNTVDWYYNQYNSNNVKEITINQIKSYQKDFLNKMMN
ncbi:CDP-glucose 4,6-dehydratase [Aureibaculum sp. A20]|uniref:CDP-glucose 4,6-dehydratase n=1 Tax=Aureibaculum flavum TaxID=2795986 RepID=A0ABS0WKX0_9FLAO|nr:CDP-glucose 4,6-dehydratase [Aureibaculum flavum]MBJ2172621.1 CDP-glucose 4,6-dehydratase [Aureibaculum flavum]